MTDNDYDTMRDELRFVGMLIEKGYLKLAQCYASYQMRKAATRLERLGHGL